MDKSIKSLKHWQLPVVGVLGLWLAVSPWVVGPTGTDALVWGTVALGLALVAAAAGMAHPTKAAWAAWVAVVIGLLAAVSPWLLGYAEQTSAATNAVATGLVCAILGFMVGLMATDPDRWWNDRVAH